jgi:squalene-associated FAD-dependent desaturase
MTPPKKNRRTSPPKRIAVIGAGWAGCAAAVELTVRGHQVSLFESARTPGGRARQVVIDGKTLDNGQHILLGAYSATLRLMKLLEIDLQQAFLRVPLQMRYPNSIEGMDFCAPHLPAPLHLLVALVRARGLSLADKMALARFSTTARWMDWGLNVDCSVNELLARFEQTERLNCLMWRPLCIAALNTPPERASANVFLRVLRDSLGASRSGSDMLLPKLDLSSLLPQPASRFIRERGGTVGLGVAIKQVIEHGNGWKLSGANLPTSEFDAVVIATPSHVASQLLASSAPGHLAAWQATGHEAITTCYLQYDASLRLARPFYALLEQPQLQQYGQFVFDRGQLNPEQGGLLAVVISAAEAALALPQEQLAQLAASQLARSLGLPQLATPLWQRVISEKRATFACAPGQIRPMAATGLRNLALAGDYIDGPYPATLEGAVMSGVAAAQLLD